MQFSVLLLVFAAAFQVQGGEASIPDTNNDWHPPVYGDCELSWWF